MLSSHATTARITRDVPRSAVLPLTEALGHEIAAAPAWIVYGVDSP